MVEVRTESDIYTARFRELEKSWSEGWLLDLRRAAIERYERLGFPTTRHEEWRYTNLAPLRKAAFRAPPRAGPGAARDLLDRAMEGGEKTPGGVAARLVFVDGRFQEALSSRDELPRGVEAGSIAGAIERHEDLVREHLSRHLEYYEDHHPFVALNTALFEDGAFIRVAEGASLEAPIHLVFLTSAEGPPPSAHPRILAVLEDGARATIIEDYFAPAERSAFTNPVTELALGRRASLDHYRFLREGEGVFHISALGAVQGPGSELTSQALCFGGSLVRNDVHASLDGDHSACTLNGLVVGHGTQHIDNHTRIVHARPASKSWEMYKTILRDKATGVFNGKIHVDRIAQKTDAKQTNRTLLLSDDAVMNTKPELEIYADDVKCTHGATIGQLDSESLFYLRARGIDLETARSMLTYAFSREVVDQIRHEPLRAFVERLLLEKLPGDDVPAGKGSWR